MDAVYVYWLSSAGFGTRISEEGMKTNQGLLINFWDML